MYYKIASEEQYQMTFKTGNLLLIVMLILSLVGLVILLIGLTAPSEVANEESIKGLNRILIGSGITVISICSIIYYARHDNPYKIVLDNQTQEVKVYQKIKGSTQVAVLPYHQIKDVIMRETIRSSGKSRTKVYTIYLQKKDATLWQLQELNSRNSAERYYRRVYAFLHIKENDGVEYQPSVPAAFPEHVMTRFEYADYVAYSWKNKLSFKFVAFIIALAGLWTINSKFYSDLLNKDDQYTFYIFGAVLLLFTLGAIYGIISSYLISHSLHISRTSIDYLQNGSPSRSIPISEVAVVGFSFMTQMGGMPLSIITKAQQQRFRELEEANSLPNIFELAMLIKDIFRIQIDALSVIDKINLEYFLEQDLKKIGASEVQ